MRFAKFHRMARTAGAKAKDHAQRRGALIARIRDRLGRVGTSRASWRELAAAAGVGLATLNHYFGKRDDVIRAVMEDDLQQGREPLAVLATPTGPFAMSIADALAHVRMGLSVGVVDMLAIGLREGLGHPHLGPVFLSTALEPIIEAAARRLSAHQEMGDMIPTDPRAAAIELIAPLVLAVLHQDQLGGSTYHPMDLGVFIAGRVASFTRSYARAHD